MCFAPGLGSVFWSTPNGVQLRQRQSSRSLDGTNSSTNSKRNKQCNRGILHYPQEAARVDWWSGEQGNPLPATAGRYIDHIPTFTFKFEKIMTARNVLIKKRHSENVPSFHDIFGKAVSTVGARQ